MAESGIFVHVLCGVIFILMDFLFALEKFSVVWCYYFVCKTRGNFRFWMGKSRKCIMSFEKLLLFFCCFLLLKNIKSYKIFYKNLKKYNLFLRFIKNIFLIIIIILVLRNNHWHWHEIYKLKSYMDKHFINCFNRNCWKKMLRYAAKASEINWQSWIFIISFFKE